MSTHFNNSNDISPFVLIPISQNKISAEPLDSLEKTKPNSALSNPMLRQCIQQVFNTNEMDLRYTLRQALLGELLKIIDSDPSYEIIETVSILLSNKHNPSEFNRLFDLASKNYDNRKGMYFKLAAQIGRDWFDTPFCEILSEESRIISSQEERILNSIKFYQKLYPVFRKSINMFIDKQIDVYLEQANFTNPTGVKRNKEIKNNIKMNEDVINKFEGNNRVFDVSDSRFLELKNLDKIYQKSSLKLADEVLSLFFQTRSYEDKRLYSQQIIDKKMLMKAERELPKMKQQMQSIAVNFLQNLKSKQQALFDEYQQLRGGKSDAELHQAISEAILGDEINKETSRLEKTLKTKKKFNIPITTSPPKSEKKIKISEKIISGPVENAPRKATFEELLSANSELVNNLSNDIKKSLQSPCHEAKIHSKELRDHLCFASLNFNLFCKSIVNQDLYALGAIIPFFCLDLHLVNEQFIKYQMADQGLERSKSHNLSKLSSESNYEVDPGLQDFIQDFSDGMLQVRYPTEKKTKLGNSDLPGPLKWVLYSQSLCQIINFESNSNIVQADLLSLCTFVFESYQKTLQHLFGMDIDANFEDLKKMVESSISKNNPKTKAIQIKKSRPNQSAILKTRTKLHQSGQQIIQKCDLKDREAAGQALTEAANHLLRLDAALYLQEHYSQLQFGALHHRNSLMFQWPLEKIYTLYGFKEGMGDLRYLSEDHLSANHDLTVFHAYTLPGVAIPQPLKEFNLGRNLHYSRENSCDSQFFKELLQNRKILKKLDPSGNEEWTLVKDKKTSKIPENFSKVMKKQHSDIFNSGNEVIEQIIEFIL